MTTRAVAGQAFTFSICLYSQADTKLLQNTPTLAAGDFVESTNGAGFNSLDNIPTVTPAAGERVEITLSAAETPPPVPVAPVAPEPAPIMTDAKLARRKRA